MAGPGAGGVADVKGDVRTGNVCGDRGIQWAARAADECCRWRKS